MTGQPTKSDWNVARAFWEALLRLHATHPAKAETVIMTLVTSTPQTLAEARNILKDNDELLR